MTDFIQRGRAEKAARIAEVVAAFALEHWSLDEHGDAEESSRRLRSAGEAQWLAWQQQAGFKRKEPPSAETQNQVIERFVKRRDREAS